MSDYIVPHNEMIHLYDQKTLDAAIEKAENEGFNDCLKRAIDIATDNKWSIDPVESILDELNELWRAE